MFLLCVICLLKPKPGATLPHEKGIESGEVVPVTNRSMRINRDLTESRSNGTMFVVSELWGTCCMANGDTSRHRSSKVFSYLCKNAQNYPFLKTLPQTEMSRSTYNHMVPYYTRPGCKRKAATKRLVFMFSIDELKIPLRRVQLQCLPHRDEAQSDQGRDSPRKPP